MYENTNPIANLIHLYIDGAFSRRELVRRVAAHVGGTTAALAVLSAAGVPAAQAQTACPAGISIPENAPDLIGTDVSYPGEAGTLFGYLVRPRQMPADSVPAIIVIHENRGLVEHIRDVTRRAARAGFVSLGVDLLSRQGGTAQFTDPVQQTTAYNKTTQDERRADLFSALDYLKNRPDVRFNRIGTVGFCAGGGNVWDLAVNLPELAAAVAFYGAPPPIDQLPNLRAPFLGHYAQLDSGTTGRMPPVITALLGAQKKFGITIYEGVGHAFHNDTGPAYDPTAACDAWAKTIAWFNKFLV